MNLEGRNEIRFNNSGGRCLLENWVEERATSHLETNDINLSEVNCAKLHQNGHGGLLTNLSKGQVSRDTTVRTSYKPPTFPEVAHEGRRFRSMKAQLIEECTRDVEEDFFKDHCAEPMPKMSVKKQDFDDPNFEFIPPKPEHPHSLYNETPMTFWSENLKEIEGVSRIGVDNRPFRKNAAFSKPYSEYKNEELPHGLEK